MKNYLHFYPKNIYEIFISLWHKFLFTDSRNCCLNYLRQFSRFYLRFVYPPLPGCVKNAGTHKGKSFITNSSNIYRSEISSCLCYSTSVMFFHERLNSCSETDIFCQAFYYQHNCIIKTKKRYSTHLIIKFFQYQPIHDEIVQSFVIEQTQSDRIVLYFYKESYHEHMFFKTLYFIVKKS